MLLHLAIPVSDQIVVPVELNIEIYRISKGQKKNQHHQPQWQKNPSNMNQQQKGNNFTHPAQDSAAITEHIIFPEPMTDHRAAELKMITWAA